MKTYLNFDIMYTVTEQEQTEPEITDPPANSVVPIEVTITGERIYNESETLELNCTSDPSATLSWIKRSDTSTTTKLLPSLRISITFQNDVEGRFMAYSVLAIRDVAESDSGTYVCVAENDEISLNATAATVNHIVHINGIMLL